MFTCVQHALTKASSQHVDLTADIHDELDTWRDLVRRLASRTTHLHKLDPSPPTWIRSTNASITGMGGFFWDPEGQYLVWRSPSFHRVPGVVSVLLKPQGRRDNKRPGAGSDPDSDPCFCPTDGTTGAHPHLR